MSSLTEGEVNRGATAQLQTNFYDFFDNLVQPIAALAVVDYPTPGGARAQMTLPMMAPGPFSYPVWTVEIDTRGMGVGPLYYSIHNADIETSIFAVDDGSFQIVAGPANPVTF